MNQEPTKGYLVVASKTLEFYRLGLNLINSLKDHYPEAKVCFVTEEMFCDGNESIADHVMYCGDWDREKLTALSKTPFDITMYIDADCIIMDDDISTVFDMLDDNDLMFTPLTEERAGYFQLSKWDHGRLKLNGGVFVYDMRKPIVKDFMKDWHEYHLLQRKGLWWPDMKDGKPDYTNHPKHLDCWDQFTLWWLVEHNPRYKDIKLKIFDEEVRWNWYSSFREEENYTDKDVVVYHLSGTAKKG